MRDRAGRALFWIGGVYGHPHRDEPGSESAATLIGMCLGRGAELTQGGRRRCHCDTKFLLQRKESSKRGPAMCQFIRHNTVGGETLVGGRGGGGVLCLGPLCWRRLLAK